MISTCLVILAMLSLTSWLRLWVCIQLLVPTSVESITDSRSGKEYVKAVYCHPAYLTYIQSSVQFSCSVMSDSLRPHESQQARPACPSPTPGVHSNSCPSSWWCHPAMLSSVIPFSCPQSLPASGSFPMSQHFTWGGQSIGVSALAPVLPKNTDTDQIRSVTKSCPTLFYPMNRSTPGLPVHHQLPEFTQTHVHEVSDVIQPSHPLSSPSPPAPNPSQHQSLFQWVNTSHEVAKVLEFQL